MEAKLFCSFKAGNTDEIKLQSFFFEYVFSFLSQISFSDWSFDTLKNF